MLFSTLSRPKGSYQ